MASLSHFFPSAPGQDLVWHLRTLRGMLHASEVAVGSGRLHFGRAWIAAGPARLPAGPLVRGGGRDAVWQHGWQESDPPRIVWGILALFCLSGMISFKRRLSYRFSKL